MVYGNSSVVGLRTRMRDPSSYLIFFKGTLYIPLALHRIQDPASTCIFDVLSGRSIGASTGLLLICFPMGPVGFWWDLFFAHIYSRDPQPSTRAATWKLRRPSLTTAAPGFSSEREQVPKPELVAQKAMLGKPVAQNHGLLCLKDGPV